MPSSEIKQDTKLSPRQTSVATVTHPLLEYVYKML